MGNWNMTIVGSGAHHNKDYANDANKLFAEFVADLRSKGHSIEHASFTYGSTEVNRQFHRIGDMYNCYSTDGKVVGCSSSPLDIGADIQFGNLEGDQTKYQVLDVNHITKAYLVRAE